MDIQRRTVLQAGGLIAAGGVVAACSSGDAGSTAAASPEASTAASPPASATAPPSAAGSPAAGGIAQAADIPVGGGMVFTDPAVVVTQPAEGDIKAFTAICPHQGCAVSEVVDNEIICPCHGSKFSASDGSVLQGPAQTSLDSVGVAVDGGSVVLT